jgi:hypothetical protein
MPTFGLEAFARESESIRVDLLERGRRGFANICAFSFREVVNNSPVADADTPGAGRLRASWTMNRGSPDYQFAPMSAGGGEIPAPSEDAVRAVADTVQLGDVVWLANGSPCVSTTNDRTSFVDQTMAATESYAQEEVAKLDRANLSRPSRRK